MALSETYPTTQRDMGLHSRKYHYYNVVTQALHHILLSPDSVLRQTHFEKGQMVPTCCEDAGHIQTINGKYFHPSYP